MVHDRETHTRVETLKSDSATPIVALLAGLGVWAAWRFVNDPFDESCGVTDSETVEWAGFTVDDKVEVSEVSSECWLDQGVSFTIRGTPTAVDEVLETSDFKGEFVPGVDFPVQASLFDESAVVRGTLDGETVLLVAAYGS